MNERISQYKARIQAHSQNLDANKRKYDFLSYSRFGVFILGVGAVYLLFTYSTLAGLVGGMAILGLFLYLVKIHTEVAENREHQIRLQEINEAEIKTLEGNWRDRESGEDLIDHSHPYTYDMDIFGRASVFQYINRTGTILGRKVLSTWIQNPEQEVQTIIDRQEAVKDLSDKIDWSLNFEALGKGKLESEDDSASIIDWLKEPLFFQPIPSIRDYFGFYLPYFFFPLPSG